MRHILCFCIGITCLYHAYTQDEQRFDLERDLLLLHYDFKTDVDDLHSVAAFATLVSIEAFARINYHAVAGAYGVQDGMYVPPNELMRLAFGKKWSDAHKNIEEAVGDVLRLALDILNGEGDLWIAEGGQSDFSARLVSAIRSELPGIDSKSRIHIIQHSNWNEEVTSKPGLRFVKDQTDYQKIPDGNAVGNGTPGFRSDQIIDYRLYVQDEHLRSVWELAIQLANIYNGKDGRYLNVSVAAGGLDFSDFSEVCWMVGLENLKDGTDFFKYISNIK